MTLRSINSVRLLNQNINNQDNKNNKQSPSFGAAPLVGLANFIETQGFMGEFLTNDLFGMMGPRVWQGYGRNKEELGHLNYKAGREEAVRELLSGPAYFYVPAAIIGATSLVLGQCAKVNKAAINAFEPIMEKIGSSFKDKDLKPKFIDQLTEKMFEGFTNERGEVDKINQAMKDYSQDTKWSWNASQKAKKAKKAIAEALTNLNKANGQYIDDTRKVKIGDKEFKIVNILEDTKNYLNNFSKKAAKTTKTEQEFIKFFHTRAKNIRNTASILGIAALSAFLVIIPRLYKTGDAFPGKDGLVKGKKEAVNANK